MSWDSDGTVTDVSVCENVDSQPGVEFYNGILIPDMVNAHCHLELSYLERLIPEGGGFAAFAQGMGTARGLADAELRGSAAEEAADSMWRHGVGAVGDVCNGSSTFDIKGRSPVRYMNFIELFGLESVSAAFQCGIAQNAVLRGLRSVVTPHSTYSLTASAFCAAVSAGPADLPLSVHFMESPSEQELYEGRGELYEWYVDRGIKADFKSLGSPAHMLIECVPPERDILLIHNCCVTEEDVDMIEDHFTGQVTWVLCPCSNRYISRLQPPVELLRRKGVRIAVGTDSLASNTRLDMISELRALGNVPLEDLLAWSTTNGAAALGMEDMKAGFEPGQKSGAVLIKGIDWNGMRLTDRSVSERIF